MRQRRARSWEVDRKCGDEGGLSGREFAEAMSQMSPAVYRNCRIESGRSQFLAISCDGQRESGNR